MHSSYINQASKIASRYCRPDLGYNTKLAITFPSYLKNSTTGEVTATYTTEIIKLRLNQEKEPQSEITTGSDRDRIYLTGYLVSPTRIKYDLGDRLDGEYLYEGKWVKCEFYPVPKLADNLTENLELHNNTGRAIAGFLKVVSSR